MNVNPEFEAFQRELDRVKCRIQEVRQAIGAKRVGNRSIQSFSGLEKKKATFSAVKQRKKQRPAVSLSKHSFQELSSSGSSSDSPPRRNNQSRTVKSQQLPQKKSLQPLSRLAIRQKKPGFRKCISDSDESLRSDNDASLSSSDDNSSLTCSDSSSLSSSSRSSSRSSESYSGDSDDV
jgi:hypothetical protein